MALMFQEEIQTALFLSRLPVALLSLPFACVHSVCCFPITAMNNEGATGQCDHAKFSTMHLVLPVR